MTSVICRSRTRLSGTGPVGVSPDGCSIAFTHAPSAEADVEDAKENRRTLKVLRLCEPKS